MTTWNGSTFNAPSHLLHGRRGTFAISCPSTTFCAVAGRQYLWTQHGDHWRPSARGVVNEPAQSVSCVSSTFCMAVDGTGMVYRYSGTAWTKGYRVIHGSPGMTHVSCASTTFCALDSGGGLVSLYDGSSWSKPTSIGSTGTLEGISCTAVDACSAIDTNGFVHELDPTG